MMKKLMIQSSFQKKKREALYDLIVENALAYDIEIISVEDVDSLNVYQASKLGMEKCIEKRRKKYISVFLCRKIFHQLFVAV